MSELFGVCRYCGQTITVPTGITDKEGADAWASAHCDCSASTAARNLTEQISAAKDRVRQLFGEDCDEYGFDTPLDSEQIILLEALVEKTALGIISSVKLGFTGRGSASISITAKGKIQVQRSQSHTYKLEE